MRILMIAVAAAILLMPAAIRTYACEAGHSAQVASTELSAEEKKPMKRKAAKAKKEKVEYMRAAPMK
jgi:hypothetical protein